MTLFAADIRVEALAIFQGLTGRTDEPEPATTTR